MNPLLLLAPSVIVFYLMILSYRRVEHPTSLVMYYILQLSGLPLGFFLIFLSEAEHAPLFGIAGMLMALQPIYWFTLERRHAEF